MTEIPGKSVFSPFEPDGGGSTGLGIIGTAQSQSADDQVRALENLHAWDAMAQGAYPPNTVRAWRADWRSFVQFCFVKSESPLPASPHTVRAYVQHCMALEKCPATIRRYLATIARAHRAAGLLRRRHDSRFKAR
jgi:hypothetical protein